MKLESRRPPLICLLLLFAVVIASCSPKPSPVELVMAYENAYNSYDLERLLSLFAEDAAFEIVGQFVFKGKEEIRRVAEYDSVLNIHMSIIRFATKNNTVSCELVETNDWLKTSGIGEARYTGKFVFEEGLIKLIEGKPAPETEQAFNQVLSPLMEWASKERPEQVAEIMPEGKFVYNAENATKSLALLHEWQEATKSE
jgi:limonene-1,2-epoxide hydrolase